VAHGKTKHNRAITPMVIDITRQFPEEGLEFDDPDDTENDHAFVNRSITITSRASNSNKVSHSIPLTV
jgi:hypothetical protein